MISLRHTSRFLKSPRVLPGSRKAFTLVELLVVISIILVISAIALFRTGTGSEGAGLRMAERTAANLLQATRGQAILKQTTARLLIHNDPSDPDKYLRYFGVIYQEEAATGETAKWIPAGSGTTLPDHIYFNPELSTAGGGKSSSSSEEDSATQPKTMQIEFPKKEAQSEGGGTEWYYYEFKGNGVSQNSGAKFILNSGTPKPTSGGENGESSMEINFDKFAKGGFLIRRVGTVAFYTDPGDIDGSGDSDE